MGVQVFRSQESKKAVIWVFVSVHVSILWVWFQLFPSSFLGFKDNNNNKMEKRGNSMFWWEERGIWTTHWLFLLSFSLICARILTSTIDWKGGCYQVCLKNASKSICLPSPLFLMNVNPYFPWVSVHQTIQKLWNLKSRPFPKNVNPSCWFQRGINFKMSPFELLSKDELLFFVVFSSSCLPFQWIVHFNWFRFHFPSSSQIKFIFSWIAKNLLKY